MYLKDTHNVEYGKYTDGLMLIQNQRQMADNDSSLLGRHNVSLDEQSDKNSRKRKALQSFDMSGTTHRILHHVTEDLNLEQRCCENLKSCKWPIVAITTDYRLIRNTNTKVSENKIE
jgi:hypothetical protein